MKKFLLAICLCVATAMGSFAQKGTMAVGLDLGAAPILEKGAKTTNIGIGAKFQYGITDQVRLDVDAEYWLKKNTIGIFDATANIHYLINATDKFNVYPIVGIGYAAVSYAAFDATSKCAFNVGLGSEYEISQNIAVSLEVKYQYIKDFSRLPIQLGVLYKF